MGYPMKSFMPAIQIGWVECRGEINIQEVWKREDFSSRKMGG